MMAQSFTLGLARMLVCSMDSFDVRIQLSNNSGSMNNIDGHLVVQNPHKIKNVSCTRWEEVSSTVLWYADFCQRMEAPMVIRLLNDPGVNVGPQQLGVAASKHERVGTKFQQKLRRILHCHPGGRTSLAIHLEYILASLRAASPEFLKNKQISIVILTDGLPAKAEGEEGEDVNQDFFDTLQEFQTFLSGLSVAF